MSPPLVLIVANPYEGELCRRALGDIGVRLVLAEGGEGARDLLNGERPLVLIIADGLFSEDAKELIDLARARFAELPLFVLADREGAQGLDVQRTFLRPVAGEELADAVEKLAVAAEAGQGEAATRFVEEPVLEIDAPFDGEEGRNEAADEWTVPVDGWETPLPVRVMPRAFLAQVKTEVVPAPAPLSDAEFSTSNSLGLPPASIALGNEPVLRADDALRDPAGMSLYGAIEPSFLDAAMDLDASNGHSASLTSSSSRAPLSSLRRLDQDLSAAERRLFPDARSSGPAAPAYSDEESLGDIDLDALGVETPATDPTMVRPPDLDASLRDAPLKSSAVPNPPLSAPRLSIAAKAPVTLDELVEESGDLGELDVVELLARLHAAGFTGRLTMSRSDGQKSLFFDGGAPVSATGNQTHDRLGDLLYREGKLTREQHALTREVPLGGGRAGAQALVDLGLLKPGELFAALRRQTEEIWYSLFNPTWDRASYRLSTEQASAEDKLRLTAHPFALLLEGVRRKYGLERLVERLGPPETVLTPTVRFAEALPDMALTAAEKLAAELIDGHRSLGEIRLAVGGLPTMALSECGLYALSWVLWCIAAVRVGEATSPVDGTTWHGQADSLTPERRRALRAEPERPEDRAVDRERVQAKWQQLGDCDYFSVLGVERDATEHEILRAYERLRQDFAPQRFVEPLRVELAPVFEEIAEVLEEARRVLLDRELRHAYRSQLLSGAAH